MKQLLAAFILFTRLPFWRLAEVPAENFKHVVPYWPATGWLTGGATALVLYLTVMILPVEIALLFALLTRLLITGCLHEDGLADFLDGFGGGITRERTLAIMKDSHIGTYGVIGLILYYLLLWNLLRTIPLPLLCWVIIAGDTFGKLVASQLINLLPYARKEEDSKAKNIYARMKPQPFLLSLLCGVLPMLLLLFPTYWLAGALLSILTFILLYIFMKKRLQGYTGDCCGATFLLCELAFYLGVTILTINDHLLSME